MRLVFQGLSEGAADGNRGGPWLFFLHSVLKIKSTAGAIVRQIEKRYNGGSFYVSCKEGLVKERKRRGMPNVAARLSGAAVRPQPACEGFLCDCQDTLRIRR